MVYNTEGVVCGGGEVGSLPSLLSTLSSHFLVYCADSALLDSLELFNWQDIAAR